MAGSGYMDAENIVSNKLYYRLKITDSNGKITYTNTVVINLKNKTLFNIYPTVFSSHFTIQNNAPGLQILQIFQVDGKLRIDRKLDAGTNIISTPMLAAGVYLYRIFNENGEVQGKIIKQQKIYTTIKRWRKMMKIFKKKKIL